MAVPILSVIVFARSPSRPDMISAWLVELSTFLIELYTTLPSLTSAFSLLAFKEDRYLTGSLMSHMTKESTVITFLSLVVTSLGYRSDIILYLGIFCTDWRKGTFKDGPALSSTRTTFPNCMIRLYSLALVTTTGLKMVTAISMITAIPIFLMNFVSVLIAGYLPSGCHLQKNPGAAWSGCRLNR